MLVGMVARGRTVQVGVQGNYNDVASLHSYHSRDLSPWANMAPQNNCVINPTDKATGLQPKLSNGRSV
eukprot:1604228-Amphidinium_carterae.4